jgi:hypothetical protein
MKLDGREFSPVDRSITAAQNDYIQVHLTLAGVTDLLVELTQIADEHEREAKLKREFLTRIIVSGQKPFLIAGCYTETGKKWSRDEANRNAKIFDELTEEADIVTMQTTLALVLLDFFQLAETSWKTSRKSSSPKSGVPAIANEERERSATSR